MAARRKKKKPVRRKSSGSRSAAFGQKLAVALALIVLVLCAASATFSFFVRNRTDGGENGAFRIEVLNGTGKAGLAHTEGGQGYAPALEARGAPQCR